MKRTLTIMAGVLALALSVSIAQAGAHGLPHNWHHGFFAKNAIVTGTVTAVGTGSFTANAYVLTPGAGGSSATPTETSVTINEGTAKVEVFGQSGITVGDTFYADYPGQSNTTPITTLTGGTPSKIFAFVAPTPEVEVSGVITTAPATGTDQFTATASVVQPPVGGSPWSPPTHGPVPTPVYGGHPGGGFAQPGGWGDGYSYGGQVGGHYGFAAQRPRIAKAHLTGTTTGTAGTVILTDAATTFDVNGSKTATVANLAVGQKFTATFDGTPDETLAEIVANPAVSVVARSQRTLYAFGGNVTAVNATSSPETVTVAIGQSLPTGLFTGTETFDVGPSTFVFGGTSTSLFGSLSDVTVGDVVAGGLISQGGQTASAIEADPLQVLVDFPVPASIGTSTSTSTSSAVTPTPSSVRRIRAADLKKAMKLLGKDETKHVSKKPAKKHKKH